MQSSDEDDDFVESWTIENQYQEVQNSQFKRVIESIKELPEGIQSYKYIYAEEEKYLIGSGSYGKIYYCYYSSKVQKIYKFALKIVKIPSKFEDVRKIQEIVAFTRQQIKSLIRLIHNPNIIKIEDVVMEKSRIYMILEYCNNKDMSSYFQKLRKEKKLTKEDHVIYYFKQILNAFKDLYQLNIIHRDIKPENILVNDDHLKIADFGLSKQLFEKTQSFYEEHYGTAVTASPQIRFKEAYSNKCDIYSLGVTLYWMFYNKYPFTEQSTKEDYMTCNIFQSYSLENASHQYNSNEIKVSPEMVALMNHMMAYQEQHRIDWPQLLNHKLFQESVVNSVDSHNKKTLSTNSTMNVPYGRQTIIGRELGRQFGDSINLDRAIPQQYYTYIDEAYKESFANNRNSNERESKITESNLKKTNNPKGEAFLTIIYEITNHKFKIDFFKMIHREIYDVHIYQKSKNKIQFYLMRDFVRYGLEMYILKLQQDMHSELDKGICRKFTIESRNLIYNEKYYKDFINQFYAFQVDSYEKSHSKPKLSLEEIELLKEKLKENGIFFNFSKEKSIYTEIRRGMVELIYFMKPEIQRFSQLSHSSFAEIQSKRYKSLILKVHHFYMFIMQKDIFSQKYDPQINYNFAIFEEEEKFNDEKQFKALTESILEILERFQ